MVRLPGAPGVTTLAAVPGAPAPPTPRVPPGLPVQSDETAAPRRILIVDEDGALVQTLRAALDPRYHVETAPTSATALESIARSPADLVLLDQFPPDLPGVAVHCTIRQISPPLQVSLPPKAGNADGPMGLWGRSSKLTYLATGPHSFIWSRKVRGKSIKATTSRSLHVPFPPRGGCRMSCSGLRGTWMLTLVPDPSSVLPGGGHGPYDGSTSRRSRRRVYG